MDRHITRGTEKAKNSTWSKTLFFGSYPDIEMQVYKISTQNIERKTPFV